MSEQTLKEHSNSDYYTKELSVEEPYLIDKHYNCSEVLGNIDKSKTFIKEFEHLIFIPIFLNRILTFNCKLYRYVDECDTSSGSNNE